MAYDKRMDNLPLFISFPRCGSHWLNCVMELYFNRPRLREGRTTFLPPTRQDWMWFHDHDLELNLNRKNVLYLYRNPVDVLFSDTMSEKEEINEKFIFNRAKLYNKHLKLYLLEYQVKCYIRYEDLIKDFNTTFAIATKFFNKEFDTNQLEKCKRTVTKEALAQRSKNKQFINMKLTTQDYSDQRDNFRLKYSQKINEIVITKDLELFFE